MISKVFVATGCASGLGFHAVKKLLLDKASPPYRFVLAVRNSAATEKAFTELRYDTAKHSVVAVQTDLASLQDARAFAQKTLDLVGTEKIDYVLLNAALRKPPVGEDATISKWSEMARVNWLSQHYILLLIERALKPDARLVFVNSGASRMVKDPSTLHATMLANSGDELALYCASKAAQLLNAHWWRGKFQGSPSIVAVSPGLILTTGLARHIGLPPGFESHPDAVSADTGAQAILYAVFKDDLPTDDRMFLTSKNTWASAEEYSIGYNKEAQIEWSPSVAQIEQGPEFASKM